MRSKRFFTSYHFLWEEIGFVLPRQHPRPRRQVTVLGSDSLHSFICWAVSSAPSTARSQVGVAQL